MGLVRRVLVAPVWQAAILGLIVFSALSYHYPSSVMAEGINVFRTSLVLAVVVAYSFQSFKSSIDRRPDGTALLAMGIGIGWFGVELQSIWGLLWRLSGSPAWMLSTWISNLFVCVITFGAAMHLLAPGVMNGVPKRSAIVLGCVTGLACLVALSIGGLREDAANFTDRIRPYIEDHRPRDSSSNDSPGEYVPRTERWGI